MPKRDGKEQSVITLQAGWIKLNSIFPNWFDVNIIGKNKNLPNLSNANNVIAKQVEKTTNKFAQCIV